MSKVKLFIQNQILEKALGSYRPSFRYGERLQMYNHVYKVITFQDKGYTFLEDEKNSKIAYPTNKLRMLMKQNLCRSLGVVNTLMTDSVEEGVDVKKAQQISGAGSKVGVTPKAINETYSKQSGASPKAPGQPRGEAVGTVKQGADGQTYKKTSASPAVWVRVASGTVHHEAGGPEHDPMSVSQEVRDKFHKMSSHLDQIVSPEDRPKIQKKMEEWFQENSKFKHMQAAHNTQEVDSSGKKQPRQAIAPGVMRGVHAQGDKARRVRQELLVMVKESHKKGKGA